jgi:hypothetical protein
MASRYKLRLKRNRRRERARARVAMQPVRNVVTGLQGAELLQSLDQRFDKAFESKSPRCALVSALTSKN